MQRNTQYKDIGTIFHKLHSGYFIFYNRKKNLKENQTSKIIGKQQQQKALVCKKRLFNESLYLCAYARTHVVHIFMIVWIIIIKNSYVGSF